MTAKIFNKKEPIFYWTGINTQGKKLSGTIQAVNKIQATLQLKNQAVFFIKIRRKYPIKFLIAAKKIPPIVFIFFFRQLATLITSGIPIVQSLVILKQSHDNSALQDIIIAIKTDLETGKELAYCLRQFPRYFNTFTCQLVHVGEKTGTLAIMLTRIATHKENLMYLKKKIIQALFYPAIILFVAMLVSIIMLTFVVPRFAELFQNMHGTLPMLTIMVIHLSHFIRHDSWIILIPCIGSLFAYKYFKHSPTFKIKKDITLLHTPLLGRFLSKIYMAHFARSLAIAFNSGIPILEALKLITESTDNYFYTQTIYLLQLEISKGQQLHKAMQLKSTFPPMMIHMVKIGEESGTLEKMLEKIAEIYEADIDHLLSHLSHILEPLIMIILGVLIGGLVIAMYLPIFKLGTLL